MLRMKTNEDIGGDRRAQMDVDSGQSNKPCKLVPFQEFQTGNPKIKASTITTHCGMSYSEFKTIFALRKMGW